jgi:hypothetical protein
MSKVFVLLLLLASIAGFSSAQDTNTIPAFVTTDQGELWYYDQTGDAQEITGAFSFRHMAWNGEGSKLAMLLLDPEFSVSLAVADAVTGEVTFLQTPKLESGFNLSWTRDGRILFAAYNPQTDPEGTGYFVDIHAIAAEANATSEVLGTFAYGVGCGGGSNIPADWVYWDETAGFGGFFLLLADTPYGIVHSLTCGGSGVGIIVPTSSESTNIVENFSKVVVSPDGSRLAGLELNYQDRSASRVMVYDLATEQWQEVETNGEPDLLAWNYDGSAIYYSMRTVNANLIDNLTQGERVRLNSTFGYEVLIMDSYRVNIHQIDLATGTQSIIYEADAYAIGRMIETADALYFSQIPNINEWLRVILNDETNYQDTRAGMQFVEPAVLRLAPAESAEASFLGFYNQFTPVVSR